MALLVERWNAGGNQAFVHGMTVGDTHATVVDECATPAFRRKQFFGDGIINDPGNQLAIAFQCQRHGEKWMTMEIVGGAIEGIDNPPVV